DPDWIFTIDRNAAVGNTEVAPLAERLAADERVTATSAWQEGRVIHLDSKIWYLMTGGIDGMTASAEAAAAAFAQAQ
ncbi:MAG TPA: iron ABC transporter substrate-binding protein, partial [Paracoccus solventivorans]|nr:iron ABC transporter substrate-binding protein [Paracoccus solventivorans]